MKNSNKGYQLCREEIEFYHENGYLVIENLFTHEECDRMLSIFEQHADKDFSAIMNIDRKIPEIREVMKDPCRVCVLDTVQGAPVVALMSQVLFKKVGSPYASQAWNPHQDNCYPRAVSGAYITINIFLADSFPENGGLYIFPGSHKEGLLPAAPTISYHEAPGTSPGNTVQVPEKYKKVDLSIPKGGMIVLHGDVIHGSYPNRTKDKSRPLFSVSYITEGVEFISGKNAQRMIIPVR